MGVRFPSIASSTFVGPLPANANETVILTTPQLNISLDFSQIFILWACDILAGTTTSALVFRLRRGTTVAGTLINAAAWTHTLAAGNSAAISGAYFDTPGAVAGQQYSLTVSQTAATAAGTFNDGSILAFAL